jgi:hypothetical protein
MTRVLLVLAVAMISAVSLHGQWLKIPTAGIPRLPNGRVNLDAPAPRSADGRPLLGGLWKTVPARLIVDVTFGLPPGQKLP